MDFKTEQQEIPEVRPLIKQLAKKEKPGSGRRVIIGLFLATVLVSLGFWLKAEIPGLWEKITSPLVISNIPPAKKFDPSPVLTEIENLTKDLRGNYGVYVYRFEDGNQYGLHQGEIFPAASLNKLPVMIAAYQQAEQGKLDLETKYSLQEKDKVQGAGILQSKPAGSKYTYRQLTEYMGQYSDNTAFKVMQRLTGEKVINQITPKEVGEMFSKLYQGELINQGNQDELLRFLTKTAFEEWIPAGVPKNIRVAHKIGKDVGTFSDGGIIFAEKPFVLVIMSKNAKEDEAKEALPKITKAVWEWEKAHSEF